MKKSIPLCPTSRSRLCPAIPWHTRFSIWWLRNFEEIIHFWTSFSWVWAFAVVLSAIVGYMPLFNALAVLFVSGVILQSAMVLCIRSISTYLKSMEEGPEKEKAHDLMIQIIKRRMR
jgi:divalent metal cation (Fe/Co/Zn/Cd) transporter